MSIDLVVVSYNTIDNLRKFLDTLNSDLDSFPDKFWNLHIADNGSTDGSREFLAEAFKEKKYGIDTLALNKNVGYAKACNVLAAQSDAPALALCNADIWMTSTQVYHSMQFLRNNPGIGVMGPKQRNEAGEITHAGIVGDNEHPRHRGWKMPDPADTEFKDLVECVTVSGSAYFVQRSAWNEAGYNPLYRNALKDSDFISDADADMDIPLGFLPTPHFYEETFCSYHMRHLGYPVVYNGRISIGHSWSASTGGDNSSMRNIFLRSQAIFRDVCDRMGISHD